MRKSKISRTFQFYTRFFVEESNRIKSENSKGIREAKNLTLMTQKASFIHTLKLNGDQFSFPFFFFSITFVLFRNALVSASKLRGRGERVFENKRVQESDEKSTGSS